MKVTANTGALRRTALWRLEWAVMTILAVGVSAMLSRYLSLNPAVYFDQHRDVYLANQLWITLHLAGGVVALLLGPFQFANGIRLARPGLHRWLERVYLAGILVGSVGALRMSFLANGGFAARLGFFSMAVLWFVTGLMAYTYIRRGEPEVHRW